MKDKFLRGLVSGAIAGIVKDIPAFIFIVIFKQPRPTFWDYMSLLAFGSFSKRWYEYLLAISVEVSWCTFLAIAFVYLQPKLKSKHYILQGIGFGLLIWLFIRGIAYFSRSPELIHVSPLTASMNATISMFFGVMVTLVDHYFEKKS